MKKKVIVAVCILMVILILAGLLAVQKVFSSTDIPKLYLEGNITGMESKEDERQIAFRYDDGVQNVAGFAKIKVQGTSSLEYEKKNYTLKFYADDAYDEKLKIDVGWGPQSKYCMKANWIDKTHARNVVTAKLVGQMQEKYGVLTQAPNHGAIDGFPVEIYSNGRFLGLYTFNIPKDAWQFAMEEDNPDHIVLGGEILGGVTCFEEMPDFEAWEVEVGEASEETLNKLNRLYEFVLHSSDEEFRSRFGEYLNLDAALNYYVMSDVAYLLDNRGKNMLLATYDGLEWYLSLYDLDTSWGSDFMGTSLWPYEEELIEIDQNKLFDRMEETFSQELAERYFELRSSVLSDENIMKEFYAFREMIPEATFVKEQLRWSKQFLLGAKDLPGYEYDQIESYLQKVSEKLDAKYAGMLAQ